MLFKFLIKNCKITNFMRLMLLLNKFFAIMVALSNIKKQTETKINQENHQKNKL